MIRVRLVVPYPALEAGVRALLGADAEITVLDALPRAQQSNELEAAGVYITTSAAFPRLADRMEDSESPAAGIIVLGADNANLEQLWARDRPWAALPMEVSSEELCAAVRAVAAGLIVGTPSLLNMHDEGSAAEGPLTDREIEVLGLLSQGLANKQIAVQLGISEHTVKFHVSSIYTKLNVSNRTEAVHRGLRNGWIAL